MKKYFNIVEIYGVGEDSTVELTKTFETYDEAQKYLDMKTKEFPDEESNEYLRIKRYGDYSTFIDTMDPDNFRYIGILSSKININD